MNANVGSRAVGVAAGLCLDRVLGEPPAAWHPVVWFGAAMQRLEKSVYADSRAAGAAYALSGVALGWSAGALVRSTTAAVAVCVAGRELRKVAVQIEMLVLAGDLPGARAALPSLVGRDPSDLDTSAICAAVIESVAENSVDAIVAPAFWGLALGAPGACAYRAINTMDAMVGHRGERYGRFGTAAARIDDVANWVPARIFAALVAVAEPTQARRVAALVARDAGAHPSPNAGVSETAVAAALGCELGGPLNYGPISQDRPRLGQGPRPVPADVTRAIQISRRVERAVVVLSLARYAVQRLRRGPAPGRR